MNKDIDYKEKAILNESKNIMKTLRYVSDIIREDNPLSAYKISKTNEAKRMQNKINALAERRSEIIISEKHIENEKMLQKIYQIYQVIHFHKLLTVDNQKYSTFHFSDLPVPGIIKDEMSCDEICDLLLNNFDAMDIISFNTLIFAISNKKETIDFLFSKIRERWPVSKTRVEEFLYFWMNRAPEVFADKSQLERQRFPVLSGFDSINFFSEADKLVLMPVVNKPVSIINKFEIHTNDMRQLIFDFEQHIYEVYGPHSASIKGFSADDVANVFFVIFSLIINQKRIDSFLRNLMISVVLHSSFVQCSIFNSISKEFVLTVEKYMNNPNTTDNELMLIIKRYTSIIEACKKLNCEFLSNAFAIPENAPVFVAMVNRFNQNKFEDGIKAWNELQNIHLNKNICNSSDLFRKKIMEGKLNDIKNELPSYPRFHTEVLHAKEITKKLESNIYMEPYKIIAYIFDAISGSQRCVESKPISMDLLYSSLSFMLRSVDDPEMKRRNQ